MTQRVAGLGDSEEDYGATQAATHAGGESADSQESAQDARSGATQAAVTSAARPELTQPARRVHFEEPAAATQLAPIAEMAVEGAPPCAAGAKRRREESETEEEEESAGAAQGGMEEASEAMDTMSAVEEGQRLTASEEVSPPESETREARGGDEPMPQAPMAAETQVALEEEEEEANGGATHPRSCGALCVSAQ